MAQTLSADVEPLLGPLTSNIRSSTSTLIAVAYLRKSGFSRIRRALVDSLDGGSSVRMLIGTGFALTDYQPLAKLVQLAKKYPKLVCNVFESSPGQSRESFHPKLYLFSKGGKFVAIVGSSNISNDALTTNIEANVLVRGKPSPFWGRLTAMFDRWWMMSNSKPLTADYVSEYRKYKRRADFFQSRIKKDKKIRESKAKLPLRKLSTFTRTRESWTPPTRVARPSSFRGKVKMIPPRWIDWDTRAQSRYGQLMGQSGNQSSIRFNTRSMISDFRKLGFVDSMKTATGLRIRRSSLGTSLVRARNYARIFARGVENMNFGGVPAYSTVGRILQELVVLDGLSGAFLTRDDFRCYIVWLTSNSKKSIRRVATLISRRHRIGKYPSDSALGIDESFAHDRHLMSLLASTTTFERAPGRSLILSSEGRAKAF
jgi:HKD family nuclease